MIATKESFDPHSSEQLPGSKRVYVPGTLHPDIRVPMREVELAPTKTFSGAVEANEPVRVYDCSGPRGDPNFAGNSDEGLPALRAKWIRARGDVVAYDGREVKPQDNGYLSGKLAEYASQAEKNRLVEFPGLLGQRRKPLRARTGMPNGRHTLRGRSGKMGRSRGRRQPSLAVTIEVLGWHPCRDKARPGKL